MIGGLGVTQGLHRTGRLPPLQLGSKQIVIVVPIVTIVIVVRIVIVVIVVIIVIIVIVVIVVIVVKLVIVVIIVITVIMDPTANLPTNIVDFGGFDSSNMVCLRGEIPRPTGDFPESLSQAMSAGIMLVG